MFRNLRRLALVPALAALVGAAGCGGSADDPAPAPAPAAKPAPASDAEHGHKPTARGGVLFTIGRDNYHGEAVFEQDGVVRFFTLGRDEATVVEVEAEPLTAYARADDGVAAVAFVLKAEPQLGDAPGKTSQFVGKLPRELWGKTLGVAIPAVRIGGERFRVGFSSGPVAHAAHADAAVPAGVADAEERKLYLTPGGKYTAADIVANGGKTASEKFKGRLASHDLRPKAGDRICPVTLTKASPTFAWVIGGQEYQFCCPPCVDEFVQLAKDKPDEIKPAAEYVKK